HERDRADGRDPGADGAGAAPPAGQGRPRGQGCGARGGRRPAQRGGRRRGERRVDPPHFRLGGRGAGPDRRHRRADARGVGRHRGLRRGGGGNRGSGPAAQRLDRRDLVVGGPPRRRGGAADRRRRRVQAGVSRTLALLRNAELYDPAPRGRRHLLVAGETVLWAGRDVPTLDRSLDVEEVDLGGHRVIPGLIDGHVHLTGGGGEAGPETRVPPVALSQLTLGGVTTAVGVLGTDDAVRTTAELVTVTRGLVAQGLSAWCHTGGYHIPPTTATGSVRLDIVLIDLVIGVGEVAISDHRSSQPTLDELLRVAGEAHVGGLM